MRYIELELKESAPLDDLITASKTAEQQPRYKKEHGGAGSPKFKEEDEASEDQNEQALPPSRTTRRRRPSCLRGLRGLDKLEEAPPFAAYPAVLWLHSTCALVLLVVTLMVFYYVAQLEAPLRPVVQHASELLENWEQSFLQDIAVQMGGQECPDGYEILVNNTYEGSASLCDCLDASTVAQRRREVLLRRDSLGAQSI